MNFKVTFQLDGTGIQYDPYEPIHLDSLLIWALAPMQTKNRDIQRDDVPNDIQIPLMRTTIRGYEIWHGSALFPEGIVLETLRYRRKRFRQNRVELIEGSPNLTGGPYKDKNMPNPLLLVSQMIAYGNGNRKSVAKILKKHIQSLGRQRAVGYGRVVDVDCVEIADDWSLVKDDLAMRWLPDEKGIRTQRVCPPYWNNTDRIKCCDVGDEYDLTLQGIYSNN
ncbi:hypothetical protein AUJ63_04645 [Candidatus Pacearchaeota archaeon CG1_02_35_32]|nr:MAG: hypothetical protein AUJ63_04645 [Candidatus Pacearchaeota archaeon CG1_02_35_32]